MDDAFLFVVSYALPVFGASSTSNQFDWSHIISIFSLVVSAVLTLVIFLINRKNSAEEKLRASELARIQGQVDQLRSDFSDIRKDIKELGTKIDNLQATVLTHQTNCAQKFVCRADYIEDIRANRESLTILRDTIRQQADVIERLRE